MTLRLRTGAQFDLVLLSETGRARDCECGGSGGAYIRRGLSAGHYFAVVRAREGSGGSYRLSLLIREITQTQTLVAGSRSAALRPGQTASVEVRVTPAAAGRVQVRIDRFLPLDGWVFSRLVNLQTGSDGVARFSWRPPAPGHWRLRYYLPDGSRKSKQPFLSKSAAWQWYRDSVEPLLNGGVAPLPTLTLARGRGVIG